jgi:hypothetical protein
LSTSAKLTAFGEQIITTKSKIDYLFIVLKESNVLPFTILGFLHKYFNNFYHFYASNIYAAKANASSTHEDRFGIGSTKDKVNHG